MSVAEILQQRIHSKCVTFPWLQRIQTAPVQKKPPTTTLFTKAEAKETSHHRRPRGQSAADSYLFTSAPPCDNTSFTLPRRKCFIWETKCRRKEKKSNISQGDFNTAVYLKGRQWEWQRLEGIGRCSWFSDMVLLSLWDQNKVLANWPAGILKVGAPSLSRDGRLTAADGSSEPKARLTVTLGRWIVKWDWHTKAAGSPDPERPPCPALGQPVWQWGLPHLNPSSAVTQVIWADQLGTAETHQQALGRGLLMIDSGHLSRCHFS